MSEAKFTKGEWVPALRNDDELQTTFFGIVFGGVFLQIGSGNENRINAHLIAAAPEMYHKLVEVESHLDSIAGEYAYNRTMHDEIIELLAKARGEHE